MESLPTFDWDLPDMMCGHDKHTFGTKDMG